MRRLIAVAGVLAAAVAAPVLAETWQGEIGLEGRLFQDKGLWDQPRAGLSMRFQPEYRYEWNERDDMVEFIGFLRLDQHDAERTHADIRELSWLHVGSGWELRAGVSKVFWGVTESQHLVDVINQTDLVENPDGEDKLGQPMLRFTFIRDWGTLDFFALPYFRERTFPGEDGRFRLPLLVDTDQARYESGAKEHRIDGAVRYRQSFAGADISIAHFSGTSRDPLLLFNGEFTNPRLIPYYSVIDQSSLTLQYVIEGWLWKLEAVTRSGEGDRYTAAVGGFEYTQVGVFDSDMDLGWVAEYMFDDRKDFAPTFLEADVFLGCRLTLNDAESTEALAGVIWDPQSEEKMFSMEASTRVADVYKVALEARVFAGGREVPREGPALFNYLNSPDVDNKLGFFQSEDYLQLEITRYF